MSLAKKVEEILKELNLNAKCLTEGGNPEMQSRLGKATIMADCERDPDEPSEVWTVVSFANHPDDLVGVTGYYDSWNGIDWNNNVHDVVSEPHISRIWKVITK